MAFTILHYLIYFLIKKPLSMVKAKLHTRKNKKISIEVNKVLNEEIEKAVNPINGTVSMMFGK